MRNVNTKSHIPWILAYCLACILVRLSIGSSMELDEAEQFWYAQQDWALIYPRQAPLYTWITKSLSYLVPINIVSLTILKYSILASFYIFFYQAAKYVVDINRAFQATLCLLTIPIISYVFVFDLSHTILMASLSSLSLYLYFKLIDQQTWFNYLSFGASLGLGCLAKYNFALLALVFVVASLIDKQGRKVLLSTKTLWALGLAALIIMPHALALITNDFSNYNYVVETSAMATDTNLSKTWYQILSKYIPEFLICIALCYLAKGQINSSRLNQKYEEWESLQFLTFFTGTAQAKILLKLAPLAFIAPIITANLMMMQRFQARWGAMIYPVVVLAIFIWLKANNAKLITITSVVIIFLSLGARLFLFYGPNLTHKIKRVNIDFKTIALELEQRLGKDSKLLILTKHKHTAANLKQELPQYKYAVVNEQEPMLNTNKITVVWNISRFGSKIPESLKAYAQGLSRQTNIRAKYLHGDNLDKVFKLGLAF